MFMPVHRWSCRPTSIGPVFLVAGHLGILTLVTSEGPLGRAMRLGMHLHGRGRTLPPRAQTTMTSSCRMLHCNPNNSRYVLVQNWVKKVKKAVKVLTTNG